MDTTPKQFHLNPRASGQLAIDRFACQARTLKSLHLAAIVSLWLAASGLGQTTIGLYPGLTITGEIGKTHNIQSTTNLAQTNAWLTVTNLTLIQPSQLWIDTSADSTSGSNPRRFYRVSDPDIPGGRISNALDTNAAGVNREDQ